MATETTVVDNLVTIYLNKNIPDRLRGFACEVARAIEMHPILGIRPDRSDELLFGYYDAKSGQRYSTTLGKIITRQLGFPPSQFCGAITQLTDAYTAEVRNKELIIEEIDGGSILDAYHQAIGGHSCMTDACYMFTKLYADNPDRVSMVTGMCKATAQTARALVWRCDNGDEVLDRIYPNSGWHIGVMEKWARARGLFVRPHHGPPNSNIVFKDAVKRMVTVCVKRIDPSSNYTFPYVDTFRYATDIRVGKCKLSNATFANKFTAKWRLGSTRGERVPVWVCEFCGSAIKRHHRKTHHVMDFGDGVDYTERIEHSCGCCMMPNVRDCVFCFAKFTVPETNRAYASNLCPVCFEKHEVADKAAKKAAGEVARKTATSAAEAEAALLAAVLQPEVVTNVWSVMPRATSDYVPTF